MHRLQLAAEAAPAPPREGKCPAPPIDHLAAEGQPVRQDDEYIYDKKKGNPGPKAKFYEVLPSSAGQQEATAAVGDMGPVAEEVPMSEQEQMVQNAMTELTMLFPEITESWLRKCVDLRMVQDKWDLDRMAAYIFEHENIAPRKPPVVRVTGNENLEAHKENLFSYRHDVDNDYKFFAEVKLTEMFPNLSMGSIRRVFSDFRSHYIPTAITLAEALEDYFERENKSWDDMLPMQWIWVLIKRDGKLWRYPLQVVKGMKCWSKKKGRTLGFPRILFEELKMTDTYVAKMRKRRLDKKLKRLAEEEYRRLVAEAKARGETAECSVCGADFRLKEDLVRCTDGHEFCTRCLKNLCWEVVAGQVKLSLNGEVECFLAACQGKFTFSVLQKNLESEHMRRIEEIHVNNMINAANLENVMRCNYCSYFAVIDVPPEVDKVFACQNPRCMRQICRLCGETWKGHEGRGCRPKELTDEALSRMKFEEATSAILTRTCHKCKTILVKQSGREGGCNKVACRCGAKMCYVCRAPDIGYDHFCRHLQTGESERCKQCNGCLLWEDVNKRDQNLINQLRMKYEIERLAKLEDETSRVNVPKTPNAATPAPAATTPAATPTPPAPAAGAQAAFQRQFG